MSKITTKRRPQKYRRLTVEVREDFAKRLDKSARTYSRYQSPNDVAAECVHLYLNLLERVDKATESFKRRQIQRELRKLNRNA
jgi:hypothetical protein